jgi:ribosomal protein S18 acetylase RimI-like enzyme
VELDRRGAARLSGRARRIDRRRRGAVSRRHRAALPSRGRGDAGEASPPLSAPTVSVRRTNPGDASTIATLESLAFDDPWSERQVADSLSDPAALSWIAEHAGEAVGFALFRRAADEIELLRIGVDPAWRRAGIGGELVARGLAAGIDEGAAICHLEVRADNRSAERLYLRLGFALAGRRLGYYGDGVDALLFQRALPARPAG